MEHATLLAQTVRRFLARTSKAVFLVESPLREGYKEEIEMLREELRAAGLVIREEGVETGVGDWGSGDERE